MALKYQVLLTIAILITLNADVDKVACKVVLLLAGHTVLQPNLQLSTSLALPAACIGPFLQCSGIPLSLINHH